MYKKIQNKIQSYLSHNPILYALIVGVAIVLFWRGVWHTADQVHNTINYFTVNSSITFLNDIWWDGPLSFLVGSILLYVTGAFTSSFIGNELILSGLRGERKLSERNEMELKNEEESINEIKEELLIISRKLELLNSKAIKNHQTIK